MSLFKDAFKTTLPVAFGYIPLGMAFGILLQNIGVPWFWATLMGLFVYAGAAQFMAVTLLSQKVGLTEVFSATLLLNLRHVFYGVAMIERFKPLKKRKLYAIFGLTDETFSILSSSEIRKNDSSFIVTTTAMNHFWWVLGCTIGSILKTNLNFNSNGLEFSLTCLFTILLLETWLKSKDPIPILMGALFGAISLILFHGKNFLLSALFGVIVTTPFLRRGVTNG
jgi:4-azaleucine resistance transporter AzlC